MTARLSKPALFKKLLAAIELSGSQSLIIEPHHPFLFRVFKGEHQKYLMLRIYIWNCTHGGKNHAADEFRVQLTGVVPIG
ncbi:MAG: hypothetical protein KME49_22610 [Brasilonema octagenarum HA4186-MV1]|jgi:putative restriction endonuclease|nr:hypothetical protein [Brasilonema octagenarum HA4186-MV1]